MPDFGVGVEASVVAVREEHRRLGRPPDLRHLGARA
jgi:hypothetical protein